jgi:3-phosphoshikimate 1-carboxyvinyltransferase
VSGGTRAVTVRPAARLHGATDIPGDKSISHRALIVSAFAAGRSIIHRPGMGADVRSTRRCLQALGVHIEAWDEGLYVDGRGFDDLAQPGKPLDCGNSGTTLRLLMGALSATPLTVTLTGDASLRRRPMGRVAGPLERMGARFGAAEGGADGRTAPLTVHGTATPEPIEFTSPVASAQVKTAVMLCGLRAKGRTVVHEPQRSRDHTERMLRLFGVDVIEDGLSVGFSGPAELGPARVDVPGDLSSAVFWAAAATALPGSRVVLRRVGVNPTRTGALDVLAAMGAEIHRGEEELLGFEPTCDLLVVGPDGLAPFAIGAAEVPRLVDEVPVLAVLATRAAGVSEVRGAGELRHKESDRIASTAAMLRALGATCEELTDGLRIPGPQRLCGGVVDAGGDHRIAMAAAVAALGADAEVEIRDAGAAEVSYPGFFETLEELAVR